MAESSIILESSAVEEFRCFRCKNYLSISPIVILPDGNSLCGVCSLSVEETTYRQLTFENFLKTLSYPCKFRKFGCKERLQFGKTQDHDAKCVYRPMICPVSLSCNWEGSIEKMIYHLNSSHSNLIATHVEFKLAIYDNKDQEGLLLICINEVYGILKYSYSVTGGNLQYILQHFNTNVEKMLVKILLSNDLDSDYKIQLKGDASSPFDCGFYTNFSESPSLKTLSLNNLLPVLNNPSCITLSMDLQVLFKSLGENVKQEFKDQPLAEGDYDFIEKLRCCVCLCYLIPPLYKKSGMKGCICWYCRKKYSDTQPELDEEILQTVVRANFPCRWRRCQVVEQGINLVNHELSCGRRIFKCVDCGDRVTRANVVSHMTNHGYVYFKDQIKYHIPKNHSKTIFTFVNDDIAYIISQIDAVHSAITFELRSEYSSIDSVSISMKFAHDHCKIQSQSFSIKLSKYTVYKFKIKKLPACFNDKQSIMVTLKL